LSSNPSVHSLHIWKDRPIVQPKQHSKILPNFPSPSTPKTLFKSLFPPKAELSSINPLAVVFSFISIFYASIWPRTHKRYYLVPHKNLQVGSHLIPHDDKLDKGGEDAWFISNDLQTLGVFDGVGGWSTVGVDPRDYSISLSHHCKVAVDEKALIHPLQVLRYGYDSSESIVGSSTACIINISGNQFISANLGDSGFRIIRRNQVILASTAQQHRFNMPYQIGSQSDDKPEMAVIQQFTLEAGDYIILGTDGLFDNLYDEDIIRVIENLPEWVSMKTVAAAIAEKAYEVSKLNEVKIPFNEMAKLYYGMSFWDNGKQDDITVVVVRYT